MKNFYNQIINSIYNKQFYKDLDHKNTSFTMFYLLKLSLVSGLIFSFFFFIFFINLKNQLLSTLGVDSFGKMLVGYVDQNFPNDLIVKLENNHISTNTSEPVVFPVPESIYNELESEENVPKNILTITPDQEFSDELLETYSSMFVFASSSIGYWDDREGVRTAKYSDFEEEFSNFEVDKGMAIEKTTYLADKLESAAPYVLIGIFLGVFILTTIFVFAFSLIYALFAALIAFLIGLLLKSKKTYGSWYLRAIHANTLYTLLAVVGGLIIPVFSIPFLNTALVILVLYINDSFKE